MGAVRELATLAGVTLDRILADAVASGTAGRAGLSGGQEGFNRHIAEQFIGYPDDRCRPTYPRANLVHLHLDGARRRNITDPRELNNMMMLGRCIARCLHNAGFWLVSGMLPEAGRRYVLGTAKAILRKVCR